MRGAREIDDQLACEAADLRVAMPLRYLRYSPHVDAYLPGQCSLTSSIYLTASGAASPPPFHWAIHQAPQVAPSPGCSADRGRQDYNLGAVIPASWWYIIGERLALVR